MRWPGLKSTAGGLDGWPQDEVKALPPAWFSGLAMLLSMVESTGMWPHGPLNACIAMIPRADGDSSPGTASSLCAAGDLQIVGLSEVDSF